MNELDPKLIESIVQAVLARLQSNGQPRQGGEPVNDLLESGKAPTRADIHPPIGTCTGDYSKFPELAGQANQAGSASTPAASPSTEATPARSAYATQPIALAGIVTASQLQSAMDRSPNGEAFLSHDARLSPLAADLARQHNGKIKRVGANGQPTDGQNKAAGHQLDSDQWLWWTDGFCPVVQKVTNQYRHQMIPFGAGTSEASLASLARELSAAVKSKRALGGMLFVESAAKAMCYLNRCKSLRAMLGTCVPAVEQGLSDIAANVLVVEYRYTQPDVIAGMVEKMLMSHPQETAPLARDLADVERAE